MGDLMGIHVALVNELGFSPSDFVAAKERERTIREMAMHLVAGAGGALDLSSDIDVIRYLKCETPNQYRIPVITSHIDAAVSLARETIAAAAEGLR